MAKPQVKIDRATYPRGWVDSVAGAPIAACIFPLGAKPGHYVSCVPHEPGEDVDSLAEFDAWNASVGWPDGPGLLVGPEAFAGLVDSLAASGE